MLLTLSFAAMTQTNTGLVLFAPEERGKAHFGEPCSWWQTEDVQHLAELGASRGAFFSTTLVAQLVSCEAGLGRMVMGPTDEATTLVAQLESCEAGLGRLVKGPTTPRKQWTAPQAAVLAHWERVGEAVKNEDVALQRFDQCRPGLWGGAWPHRSAGVKACLRGWWFSHSQDRLIWQHTSCSTVFSARPKRDFGVMCAVDCHGSSSTENEAEPCNMWNALLVALVHHRFGEVLQPLLIEVDMQSGAVVPLCMRRAVRGALRLGRGRARLTQSTGVTNRRRCRPPATRGRRLARAGQWGPRQVSQSRGCERRHWRLRFLLKANM